MHGALLVVHGAHAHGALLGDDGARVAALAHAGELLIMRGALLSDDGALHGALHGRPLAYSDDFAAQQLSGGEVTLGLQQRAEVVDGGERARMPVAEGLAHSLQRLA